MKILFVASSIKCPGVKGGATHVTEVVTRLRATDEVLLVARETSTLPNTLAIGTPLPPPGLRQLNALRLLPRIWPAVRAFQPDVVYERGASFGLGSALGRMAGVPVVAMVLDRHWSEFSLRTASAIITTFPPLVPGRHARKVIQVQWGAATERFHPGVDGRQVRQALGIPPDRIVVCYAGSFYPWHGVDKIVAAAAKLRELPLTFLLVGQGPHRADIEAHIAREGLRDRFILTGAVDYEQVPAYVAAADICVAPYQPRAGRLARALGRPAPSIGEPLKVFEFLAAAKATITLDCDSVTRHFTGGRDLLLVDADSIDALAAAIDRLARHEDQRTVLGRNGYERVAGRLTWEAHVAHLRTIFASLQERR